MATENDGLTLGVRNIGDFGAVPTIEFVQPDQDTLCVPVVGEIINSVVDGARRADQQAWKAQVASAVESERGNAVWNDGDAYAITLGLRFYPKAQDFDVDNYVKPILDALAKGLGLPWKGKREWDYDDSNFTTLLIHRLPDAGSREAEGAAIAVSSRRR